MNNRSNTEPLQNMAAEDYGHENGVSLFSMRYIYLLNWLRRTEMFAAHLGRQTTTNRSAQGRVLLKKYIFFSLTVQWKHKSSVSRNYVQIKKKVIELELDGEQQLCELTRIQDTNEDSQSQSLPRRPTPERTQRRFLKWSIKRSKFS